VSFPDREGSEPGRHGSAAAAVGRWAAMVVLAVAVAVVALPVRLVYDMFANQGWRIDFSEPLYAFASFAPLVEFIGGWGFATVSVGFIPVVLVVAFRAVAWKDSPGPIGPVYTAFIGSIAGLSTSVGAFLLGFPWLTLPSLVLVVVGGYWAERRIRRRWGDGSVKDAQSDA
jgi:hypothetical protein